MADLSWLLSGRRSRTPTTPRSPATSERDTHREPQVEDHRRSDPSRVPSHLSFDTHASFPPEPPTAGSDAGLFVREQDKVWFNPSIDQMIETLQVFIMTRGTLQSLPIAYNGYVQHLIEAFAGSQRKIRAADAAYAEAKQSLEKHVEHFKSVADEWLEREGQYKAEIKRLEVLLSKTSHSGLEAVTLARTNSIVDRTEAKRFVAKLKHLSTTSTKGLSILPTQCLGTRPNTNVRKDAHDRIPHESNQREYDLVDTIDGAPREKGQPKRKIVPPLPKILDQDNDFLMSEKVRQSDTVTNANAVYTGIRRPRQAWAAARKEDNDTPVAATKTGLSETHVSGMRPQPLFSDDLPLVSGAGGEEVTNEGPTLGDMDNRRQMLENLLDCESSHDGINNAYGRSRNIGMSLRQSIPDRAAEGSSTSDPEFGHQRGFSGFSFVPGDDIFPVFASSEAVDGMTKAGRGSDDGIELRQYEPVRRQKPGEEEDVEVSPDRTSRGQSSLMADLATLSSLEEGARFPTPEIVRPQNSTSTVNTVIREVARGSSQDSPKTIQGVEHNSSSRSYQSADSVSESSFRKEAPSENQQAEGSARIAAGRALAKSKTAGQGPGT
ncbi:hypothetical protein F5B20DRAFT_496550 [Whalleya microplaca]|nr:hypothetical protein F5B20DRAFT_496550 [Whalleya microplaca]